MGNLELKFKSSITISGLGAANLFGYVPCKGYRSSQLIGWDSGQGTGPQSHLCNGILDCIDRSDESGCQGSSEVNEGIKMKVMQRLGWGILIPRTGEKLVKMFHCFTGEILSQIFNKIGEIFGE